MPMVRRSPHPYRIALIAWTLALLLGLLSTGSSRAADRDRAAPPRRASEPRFEPSEVEGEDDDREPPPQHVSHEFLLQRAAGHLEHTPLGVTLSRAMSSGPGGLDWTFLGPRPMTGDYWSGGGNVAGRVSCVAPDPLNANIVYVAGAQGGVWKTTDAGVTWTPLTDGLSSLASGWVTIDPANTNTLWYGTGEQHYSGDSYYGDGLFKSIDAGASWTKLATASAVGAYIARVVPKPGTSSTLYVGGSKGLVRSTDSGVSWATTISAGWCDDIAVHPTNPATVYAAINAKGIYKSTDSGLNWSVLAGGLPASGFYRINLAIAPTNASVLYASFVSGSGTLAGMFKTVDGGTVWTQLTGTPEYLGGQGWYDNALAVSPTDANICVAAGIYPYDATLRGVIRTTNGGTSWTDVTRPADGVWVHPDMHVLAFGPGGALWIGCDGGVWRTTDLGAHWVNRNAGLGLSQLYTITLHPNNSNEMLGGTQDNGNIRYLGALPWGQVIAGDGGPNVYESAAPNIFYTTYIQLSGMYKWDNGSYLSEVTGPWEGVDPADWCNGPFMEDPNASGTLLAGTNRVWRSTNHGVSWNAISDNLTHGGGVLRSMAVGVGASNTIMTGASDGAVNWTSDAVNWEPRGPGLPSQAVPDIQMDPLNPSHAFLCWDVSTGARVFETTDAGVNWSLASGDLSDGLYALSMVVDFRTTPNRLYLGTDYGVHASLDGGTHWQKTSSALPNCAVFDLQLDTVNDFLVAATHGRGAWRAAIDRVGPAVAITLPNGGETWAQGLSRTIQWSASDPSGVASVTLQLSTDGGATYPTVIASGLPNSGTYHWTVSGAPSSTARVRAVALDAVTNSASDASDTNFTLSLAPVGVDGGGPLAFALMPVAPNPGRAPFAVHFTLPTDAAASLVVIDLSGRRVCSLADGAFAAGAHDLRWDGRDASGSLARNGVYFMRLRSAGREQTRRLALVR